MASRLLNDELMIKDFNDQSQILRSSDVNFSLNISNNSNTSTDPSFNTLCQNQFQLSVACANASSLVEKIDSLITQFEENQLQVN